MIRGSSVTLRAPFMTDYPAWAELRAASREHLQPWEPLWSRDELSRGAFRHRVRHYQREAREDLGYAYFVFVAPQPQSRPRPKTTMATRDHGNDFSTDHARPLPRSPEPTLVGGVTLTNVRRGVTQTATLGYWLGAPYTGRGLAHDALQALIPFAFDILRLHRIEAAVMPSNTPSLRVLERLGFTREGIARRYLKIAGDWQDHFNYALLAEDVGRAEGGAV